jgi:hypothetical protein
VFLATAYLGECPELFLIVSFNTQDLRDCCASLERAEAVIGSAHAQELMTVLSDAEAVDTAAEFIELYAPDATVYNDSLTVPIGVEYRLSFIAIGATLARDHEAGLDWGTVRRLKMMDITSC